MVDVAEAAGVSIKTVSRVINSEPHVSIATRERVESAIEVLSYRPDQSARNLASHHSHLIGLVYDDPAAYEAPSGSFILDLQQGALKTCRANRFELLIYPCDLRKKTIALDLASFCHDTRLFGIILAAPLSNMSKIVRAIKSTNTPFVRLSPGTESGVQLSVSTNDRDVCLEMTQYLAGLGHKRIAFIAGNSDHEAVTNRLQGYRDGLGASGLRYSDVLVARGDNSIESGVICTEKLLAQKQCPTAIFAANDDMAIGALRAAKRSGFAIPSQLSIVGFDDIAFAKETDPPLTTIRQPLVRMAEKAAELLEQHTGADDAVHIVLSSKIKIRGSTGPAPK